MGRIVGRVCLRVSLPFLALIAEELLIGVLRMLMWQ
jgi:hypothetical protein